MTINLTDLVRQVADRCASPDPADVAREVGKEIDDDQLRDALDQALIVVVRTVVSRMRGTHPQISGGGHGRTDDHTRVAAPGTSAKVTAIREAWRSRLRERIAVADGWRFLGDCTAEDLDHAAGLRFEHAARTATVGRKLAELAHAIRAAGVTTVAQLPDVAQRLAA